MSTEVDLEDLLDRLDDRVKAELASAPEVVDKGHVLDVDDLPIAARRWHKVSDVVAVVADLKNSTKLGTGKWAASTASIYEASTGGVVEVFDLFDADFLAIQGDGAFALFWGERRYERALCSGITIKTFSVSLVERLCGRWTDLPETGFKVGVASSRLLAKRIGTPRNPAQQEPVWAGRAVNYAAKAAQGVDSHVMAVTGSVWDVVQKNDYLAASCSCGSGPSLEIWNDHHIENLPDDDPEAEGRRLLVGWCEAHGPGFCDAILSGGRLRSEVTPLRNSMNASLMLGAISRKAQEERSRRLARARGLAS